MLIVGNGVSRLAYRKEIEEFDGDIWIFNNAFKERWLAGIATRWFGEKQLIPIAREFKEKNGYKYEIWSNEGGDKRFLAGVRSADSGSTAGQQSLMEGFDVWCVGIDMGGYDIYCPGHEKLNKTIWAFRWKRLMIEYRNKIHWIGEDHTENMKQGKFGKYADLYRNGKFHLQDIKSRRAFKQFIKKNIKSVE